MNKSRFFSYVLVVLSLPLDDVTADSTDELATVDFSLRLPSALARFSSSGDVAGVGGASAGSPYASGINPASLDWNIVAELPFTVSTQFSKIQFDTSSDIDIAAVTAGINAQSVGSFQISASKITSDKSEQLNFLQLQGDYAQIQWGKKFLDTFAMGANVNYASFDTEAVMDGMLAAHAASKTKGVRAGVLWAASSQLLAGAVFSYALEQSRTDFLEMGCSCFIPLDDKSKSSQLRAGISYEYEKLSSIYIDLLLGRFTNSRDSINSKTLLFGIEHRFYAWLYGRVGAAHDSDGFTATTMGLGLVPSRNVSIDFAVQRDMFPMMRPEFGGSDLYNVSFNFNF